MEKLLNVLLVNLKLTNLLSTENQRPLGLLLPAVNYLSGETCNIITIEPKYEILQL